MSSRLFASNIMPLSRFKAHASEVLNDLRATSRAVVITQNGEAAAVLLPPDEYDRLVYKATFLESVRAGIADADADRMVDHGTIAAESASRYPR